MGWVAVFDCFGACRGQKHQRREKQAQHLDNSEELSHSAVAAVLTDGEECNAAAGAAGCAQLPAGAVLYVGPAGLIQKDQTSRCHVIWRSPGCSCLSRVGEASI